MNYHVDDFISVITFLGIMAFALSGAMAGVKKEADIVGIIILALMACSCGGLTRDMLIGDLPPELLRSILPLLLSLAAGVLTYFFHSRLDRIRYPIEFFDALGLGLFVVVGADKAMAFGISPVWSVLLGLLTGVGGGIVRDMMLAQVPTIFKSEIYATPALLGAMILVAGQSLWPELGRFFMVLGAFVCSGLRLMAIHFHWHIRR